MSARLVPLDDVDEALVERWRALSREVRDPNPFADADFVLPAGRRLHQEAVRAVLVVEHGNQLRFVLPVNRVAGFRRIAIPAVATWLHSYSPLGTPLVASCQPEESWDGQSTC
jgi:hypothetical protein